VFSRTIYSLLQRSRFINFIYRKFFSFILTIYGKCIKVDPLQVLFESYQGDNYGDSPKVLFEKMKEDERFTAFKFYWALQNPTRHNVIGAKTVKVNSFNYFKVAVSSGIWIGNCNMEKSLNYKPAKTFYLNLWHGIHTIKTAGNRQQKRSDFNLSSADIFLSCMPEDAEFLTSRFNVKPDALRIVGRPIDDELFNVAQSEMTDLKRKWKIPTDKKVILYAPTFRDAELVHEISVPINIKKWREVLSDLYVVIHHKHHFSRSWEASNYKNFFIDGNNADSINELYKIADILISDYSSSVYSYCILGKPIIFFPYDYDEYSMQRGVEYMPWEQFGNSVFYEEGTLLAYLADFDWEKEIAAALTMRKRFIHTDGHATAFCLDELARYADRVKGTQ
jgi:CDP-glycerol glycerophosphotransferase